MRTLNATPRHPGPDGNEPGPIARAAILELREPAVTGRNYRYLEGMAVPYDQFADVGYYMERHALGSFAKSTKAGAGKSAPLLLFHDNRSWPAGHAESWEHTADGMAGVWRLNDTPAAQQAAELAETGDLLGLSVGFQPIYSKWDFVDEWDPAQGPDHMDRVTRTESRLLEVSLTPTPAYADAGVTLVRSYSREDRARVTGDRYDQVGYWRAELERIRARGSA